MRSFVTETPECKTTGRAVVSETVKCGACGRRLRERPGIPVPERVPCAACGSIAREFAVIKNESIAVRGHMSGLQRREDRSVGFVETERDGLETAAAELPEGAYRFSLAGAPPQGESDTLTTCRILIDRLNTERSRTLGCAERWKRCRGLLGRAREGWKANAQRPGCASDC